MASGNAKGFWNCMDQEIHKLAQKQVWVFVDIQEAQDAGEKVIGSMWDFKHKRYPNRRLKKLKAYPVEQGMAQCGLSNTKDIQTED